MWGLLAETDLCRPDGWEQCLFACSQWRQQLWPMGLVLLGLQNLACYHFEAACLTVFSMDARYTNQTDFKNHCVIKMILI